MLSERLRQMPLFEKRCDAKANAPIVIDEAARNLVYAMRMYEVCGVMTREQVEVSVLRAFENAEWLYYGLGKEELEALKRRERSNDKARRNNLQSV